MSMAFNRLTWAGLGVVGFGWVLFLLQTLSGAGQPGTLSAPFDDFEPFAQNVILSGFGLAILGALQSGFSALNRFFDAILERAVNKAETAGASQAPELNPDEIIDRGRIADRDYAMFADGSVEVETLLGTRRFRSRAEAEAFVGS